MTKRKGWTAEGKRLADVSMQRMRERARASREQETDPIEKAVYDLVARMGLDWLDTESQARAVARFAAIEIVTLEEQLERARGEESEAREAIRNLLALAKKD